MRIFLLSTALLITFFQQIFAQCSDLPALQVVNSPGEVLLANARCTDNTGWTHYYNSSNDKILLSIKTNGQNIGELSSGLTIKAGTLTGAGAGGYNLSNADYIDNDIWIVANRFWQITGANSIASPVSIRFYFSHTDVTDISGSVDDLGFFVDEPDDLLMFTIGKGNGLDPFAVSTQPLNAQFTLYDMVPGPAPDWKSGVFNGFPYGEFEVSTLDIGGGAGFLIFQPDNLLAVSGNISKPTGTPVSGVNVRASSISTGTTNETGNYVCPSLLAGTSYDIIPSKNTDLVQGLSSADLIAMSLHLQGIEPFTNPYQLIAADADKDGVISVNDLNQIRDVLLGITGFPDNNSWRFVPKIYTFPNPANPFVPPFPEQITANNIVDSLFNQDFIGVKIGDVADPSPALPPLLNTSFSLQNKTVCNPGDTAVFELKVTNFQNIRAVQFTLEWNPDIMGYIDAGAYNLPGLSTQCIGTTATEDGKLSFIWFSPATAGSSASDGTALFELRFVASGNIGEETPIQITGSMVDMLLIHQNLSETEPATTPGTLLIDNTSNISATASLLPVSCSGAPTGAINLTVSGGLAPYVFQWSNGSSTEDIANLANGTYQVTVSDGAGGCPRVLSYDVPLPPAIELEATVKSLICPYQLSGTINLEVNSGTAPFQYQWSNGSHEQDQKNLYQGTYSVTVTDAGGCTGTDIFEITNLNKIHPVVSITNTTPPSLSNGSVMIEGINGGTPPFSFVWDNGATTQLLENVPAGDYVVTITDGNGCQHVFGYVVYSLATAAGEVAGGPVRMNLFPNPVWASHDLNLHLESTIGGKVILDIFTPDGKLVSSSETDMPSGQTHNILQAPETSGLYLLRVQMEEYPAGWLKVVVR